MDFDYRNIINIDELVSILKEKNSVSNGADEREISYLLQYIFLRLQEDSRRVVRLSEADRQCIIEAFINSKCTFNRNTPGFIIRDVRCAEASIDREIESINYISDTSQELREYAISKAVEKDYILHRDSPRLLKESYEVAKKSISLDVNSADYVRWASIRDSGKLAEIESLIETVCENGYILSSSSTDFLRENAKVVLASVKRNFKSYGRANPEALNDTELFQYLMLNGASLREELLRCRPLEQVCDKEVLKRCLEQIDAFSSNRDLYQDRYSSTFCEALTTPPTIETYRSVFQTVAEKRWEKYRKSNTNDLENLFGKISSELRNSCDFDTAIYNLRFIDSMKETLGDRYADFYRAMKEYFDISHSDAEDKLDKMQPSQTKISYYAALYCGKRKDDYIKEEIDSYIRWLRKFFVIRIDNPTVDKKLVQPKRKGKFRELYQEGNTEVREFIDGLVSNYSKQIDKETVIQLIDSFILEDKAGLEDIKEVPDKYDAYERYKKVDKLIKRLNQGNIKISGPEVNNYLDVIGFDEEKKEYFYKGISFSKEDQDKYSEYKKLGNIFGGIKKDIALKIKKMEMDIDVPADERKELAKELPFKDEFFKFAKRYISRFTLGDLYEACLYVYGEGRLSSSGFEDDDAYKLINEVLVNNGIVWLSLLLRKSRNESLSENGVGKVDVYKIIENSLNISKMAKELKIDLNSFNRILLLSYISGYADICSIDILGLDIVEKLCRDTGFTDGDTRGIVTRARRLVAKMAERSMSTVPYVSGETMNYKYSLYDSQDVDVLLTGMYTDACFRVRGTDNDMLHYCCLDKNGFVIRITDKEGNFIARAAGFRNGNCVFLNQLRTIYDRRNNNFEGNYDSETEEIIETLKKACEDIVRTSQENDLEIDKINHVFITRSYSMEHRDSNVTPRVKDKIGDYPMDMDSQDWEDFIEDNVDEMRRADYRRGFSNDYHSYSLICIASTKNPNRIETNDLRFGDVEAVYERRRNKIIATTNIDNNIMRKIKRIRGVYSYPNYENYLEVRIPEGSIVFVGDNWYCVYHGLKVIDSCVLDCDEKAKREFNLISKKLDEITNNYIQQQLEAGETRETLANKDVSEKVLSLVLVKSNS